MRIDALLNPSEDGSPVISTPSTTASSSGDPVWSASPTPEWRTNEIGRRNEGPLRHRRSSTTSGNARDRPRERREFRPTYSKEEEIFIWFHRIDRGLDWPDVKKAYDKKFPDRKRLGLQGIQCKYYRFSETYGVPRVRDRNRSIQPAELYGVRARLPDAYYPWMADTLIQDGGSSIRTGTTVATTLGLSDVNPKIARESMPAAQSSIRSRL
ncbi:hypothetical protein MMC25_004233 [Agyrium rufum]|nr:hypothetical protein [Agyrium rufum]